MPTMRPATEREAPRIEEIFSSSIRELAKEHYNELQIASWSGGFGVERIREQIVAGGMFVAEIDGDIAGFVEINLTTSEVEMVFVDPRYARQRVGSAMLRHVEELALNSGVKTLHLRSSLNAISFYESQGYVVTERKIHCNAQGIEFECTIMEKHLA